MTDLGAEFGYIIAIALLAKFAEATEILPDLGSSNVHFFTE